MSMESNGQLQTTEEKTVKADENAVVQDKSGRKVLVFAAIGIVLVLLAAIIAGVTVFGDSDRKLQEQLDLGAKYLEEMDYEQALVAFNTALEIESKNVDAYLGIVEVYIRMDEFETALEYAREGYEVTGDDRLKEKIDTLESMVDAQRLQEQLDLGAKYLEEMDYEQALVAFNAALEIEPKNVDAYLGIVEVYIRMDEFETALEYAREGYEVTGDDRLKEKIDTLESMVDAQRLQEQLDLGAKYLEEMDYEQALAAFNTVLEAESENADAYLGIVEINIRTNKFETALEYAREGFEVTGDERLKEKIDMIESGDIFASNGWRMKMSGYDGDGNLVFWHEYTYNLQGREASVAKYNAQGVQEQYLDLAYDEEGRRLISYSYGAYGGDITKKVYEYNGNNYRVTSYEGTSDVVSDYTEGEVDSEGKVLKETDYDKDGNIQYTKGYEYDEDGNEIKREYYDETNQLIYYSIWIYDGAGNILQQQDYDADGNLTSYFENIYDDAGNRIGSRYYGADGVLKSEQVYR